MIKHLKVGRIGGLGVGVFLILLLVSCQSTQTKSEICGKWESENGFTQVNFFKNSTWVIEERDAPNTIKYHGTYSVKGKSIIIKSTNADGEEYEDELSRMHLAEDHCLYVFSDGTKYIKVEE